MNVHYIVKDYIVKPNGMATTHKDIVLFLKGRENEKPRDISVLVTERVCLFYDMDKEPDDRIIEIITAPFRIVVK